MRINILILCSIVFSNFAFAFHGNTVKDTVPTQIERKYKLSISSNLIFENSSIDAKLFTTGNIDTYKEDFSNKLETNNVLFTSSKQGISYSKKAFNNKIGYNIAVYDRAEIETSFSKDLFDLIFFGNKGFLGSRFDLGNSSISLLKFQQVRFELSRKFKLTTNDKLFFKEAELGLAYSHLIGNSYYSFASNDSYIDFGEHGEYINSYFNITTRASDTTTSLSNAFRNNGNGHTLDLILKLKKEEHSLHLSIIDLGKINWKEDAISYSTEKNLNFSGIVIEDILNLNDSLLEQQLDSLSDFGLVEKSGSFTTPLSTTLHLSYVRTISVKHIDYLVIGHINKTRSGNLPSNYQPKYYLGSQFSLNGLHLKTYFSSGGYTDKSWLLELGQNMANKHTQFIIGTQHFESIFKGTDAANIGFYFKLNFLFGNINPN